MRFDEQTIVVTGVGREGQLGEVVAGTFAERGAAVAVIDRMRDEAHARADAIRKRGLHATAYACDLTDHADTARVAREIGDASGGKVSAVVCLAGGFAASGPVGESDPAIWERMLAINLTSAYVTTRAFLPLLRPARGTLIYFASAAALPGAKAKELSAYAVAKTGVLTLMRTVSEEERSAGVRANAIAPTAIRTAANLSSMGENARYVEREEVAEIVAWLCSEEARVVTGQVMGM